MKEITYLLYENNDNSNEFYKKISIYTKNTVKSLKDIFNKYINNYINYIYTNEIESLRSKDEYLLEILMIGVFWNNYINRAINLKTLPQNVLIKLSYLREKEKVKKIADFNRGILETWFLNKNSYEKINFSLENYNKLISYMEAIGDYKQEAKRLKIWYNFFNYYKNKDTKVILRLASDFAKKFETNSKKELGQYTRNVSYFLNEADKKYKYREDFMFCNRKEVEYHLNMVGAEIMNNAYREEFLKTKEKRLLLPACMRLKDEYNCKAIKTDEGYICANCNKNCHVNKYDELGKTYGFKIYIIPHESSISIKKKFNYGDIGIIGVACILNLISGGLKAKNIGFIPQCVYLDYCGCKLHWDQAGIITDINLNKLLYTIGVE